MNIISDSETIITILEWSFARLDKLNTVGLVDINRIIKEECIKLDARIYPQHHELMIQKLHERLSDKIKRKYISNTVTNKFLRDNGELVVNLIMFIDNGFDNTWGTWGLKITRAYLFKQIDKLSYQFDTLLLKRLIARHYHV